MNYQDMTLDEQVAMFEEILSKQTIETFRNDFLYLHPYEQSSVFKNLTESSRLKVYTYLSPEEMAEIIEYFDIDDVGFVLKEMNPTFAAQILENMSSDDAVDILNTFTTEEVASYLALINKEEANDIRSLIHYEEKTAGSIMTTEFVAINKDMKIKEAMVHLKKKAPDAESIYYVYVIDDLKRLVGVITLRMLIIADDEAVVEEVMSENVIFASASDDQEEIAKLMRDYDFLALPVVDFKQRILGIITVDDILDVMDEEASDDYSKLAAVIDMDQMDGSALDAAKKRLPWLIVLLFLGMITASLIGTFEETLDSVPILAVFIPLIAGMAGNTGTQALAVTVRGIATGDASNEGFFSRLIRETKTGMITGITCGIIVFIIVLTWRLFSGVNFQSGMYLGLIVGIAITIALIIATIAGALLPLFMHKINIDPAVASGPFITTINDIISVLIYFGLATTFMDLLI
ncbi:magnesium transporter [Bacillaceae bacterium W0354]